MGQKGHIMNQNGLKMHEKRPQKPCHKNRTVESKRIFLDFLQINLIGTGLRLIELTEMKYTSAVLGKDLRGSKVLVI